jgi:hypothetical protein
MSAKQRRALLGGVYRQAGRRRPRARFVLFCEGKNTEPDYFRHLGISVRDALVEVETVGAAGTPYTIALTAVERKNQISKGKRDSFEKYDKIWAVFDRDAHPKYDEAVDLCTQSGVEVARSNPCFELWLILHLEDYDKACTRFDVQNYLAKIHPPYAGDRRKLADAQALIQNIDAAEARALKQAAQRDAEGSSYGPPSTTAGKLTAAIRMAAGKSAKQKPTGKKSVRRHH